MVGSVAVFDMFLLLDKFPNMAALSKVTLSAILPLDFVEKDKCYICNSLSCLETGEEGWSTG